MKHSRSIWTMVAALALFAGGVLMGPQLLEPSQAAESATQAQVTAERQSLAGMDAAEQLSRQFRAVAKTVTPAVVEIRVEKRMSLPQRRGLPEGFEDFFEGLPPGMRPRGQEPFGGQPREFLQEGLGSGVIIDAEQGYVLTNNHVVADADGVAVRLADGRVLEAEWVRRDPLTDVAVLKIKTERLIAAPLGNSDGAEVGDWVLAIGSPEGLTATVTAGIISAKGRSTAAPDRYENYIQTDAAVNRGNSGGPLVNMVGEVIGINTAIISRTGANAGLGLAIPSNMAKSVLRQLIESGRVVRGFLGVNIQDVTPELARSFGLETTHGSLVTRVVEGSPADQAGLQTEDFVVAIDGEPIDNTNELRIRVAGMRPGTEHQFTVIRDGEELTVPVTIGERQEQVAQGATQPDRQGQAVADRYGLTVQTLTDALAQRFGYDEGTRGVLIAAVEPGSDAADSGLRPGMLIRRVNRTEVDSAQAFRRALDQAGDRGVRLYVEVPTGGGMYVLITPRAPHRE